MQANQFKDTEGRVWTMSITIAIYLRLKSELGLDINELFNENSSDIESMLVRRDIGKLVDMIAIILETQLEKSGLSKDDLFRAIDPDVFEQATHALLEGMVSFSPAHYREGMRVAIKAVDRGIQLAANRVAEKEGELIEQMEKAVEKIQLPSMTSSDTSGEVPGS